MDYVLFLRWLHVIGACVLLGTGAGIAFFMLMAHRTKDAKTIAHTASTVVIADTLFTLSAVIVQPITGTLLALQLGWPLTQGWLMASILLYILTGLCWLPVVWIQSRLRDLARDVVRTGAQLPSTYQRLFRLWFILGIPAFAAVLTIVWLMLERPGFSILGL